MAIETERKFLLANDNWRKYPATSVELVQGYLMHQQGRSVRVRADRIHGWLTIKGPKVNSSGEEFEWEIPHHEAQHILDHYCSSLIQKTRYTLLCGDKTWEVDEFTGANAGLIIAEVELDYPGEEIVLPDFVGQEVTDDPRYSNANLAERPFNTWDDCPGYHLADIPKGEIGEISKIYEEVLELLDADSQGATLMLLQELSDIVGAIKLHLARHHPSITLADLDTMALITSRAFASGRRQ